VIKMVCDRCGKEVLTTIVPYTSKVIMMNGVIRTNYDLCKECLYKVRNFITDAQTDCGWR